MPETPRKKALDAARELHAPRAGLPHHQAGELQLPHEAVHRLLGQAHGLDDHGEGAAVAVLLVRRLGGSVAVDEGTLIVRLPAEAVSAPTSP